MVDCISDVCVRLSSLAKAEELWLWPPFSEGAQGKKRPIRHPNWLTYFVTKRDFIIVISNQTKQRIMNSIN